MSQELKIQYLRIALRIQNIAVDDRISEQIIETYELLQEKMGNFTVHDATDIAVKIDKKYEPTKTPH